VGGLDKRFELFNFFAAKLREIGRRRDICPFGTSFVRIAPQNSIRIASSRLDPWLRSTRNGRLVACIEQRESNSIHLISIGLRPRFGTT